MRKKLYGLLALILFCILLFVLPVSAGQVVTKELSEWAKEATASEQTLTVEPTAKSIAVLYYRNQTGNPTFAPLQKGMTVMLITDLSKLRDFEEHKDIKVVERARLQALLEEVELGETGLVDIDTAPRMGKLLGARYLAGGDILKGSVTELQMEPSMMDVPGDEIFEQASAEGDLADLISMEKAILFEIIRSMKVELTDDEKDALETPLSTNVDALMDYFKGIEASDKGEFAKAAEHYAEAVAKDPKLSLAQEGIDEIEALDLLKKGAEAKPGKWGKILKWGAIGAGVVAIGVGAYIYGEKKGEDDDEDDPGPPPVAPGIVLTTPANGATGVSRSLADVFIGFSKEMKTDQGRVTSSHPVFWQNPTTVTTTWENNGQQLRVHRAEADTNLLPAETQMEFTLDGFVDKDGLELSSYWFFFITASDSDLPGGSGISIIW